MRSRIHDEAELRRYVTPTPDELAAIEATRGIFRWNVTPHYASLIDPNDPDDPIRRQVVPTMAEMQPDIVGVEDPLEEVAHSPVKNLIHNYRDRVAFCVTAECAIYCRYCLRKRMVGDGEMMMRKSELRDALAYLREHDEIRDVLLTGGDPLTMGDKALAWLLGELRDIPHIEIVRIGSRIPVKLPQRITPELCAILRDHHPVWLNTHFNHPKELTPEAVAACRRIRDGTRPAIGCGRARRQPDRPTPGHQRRRADPPRPAQRIGPPARASVLPVSGPTHRRNGTPPHVD